MTSYDWTLNLPEQTFQGKCIQYTAIYELNQVSYAGTLEQKPSFKQYVKGWLPDVENHKNNFVNYKPSGLTCDQI